jgi:hypothetical protein
VLFPGVDLIPDVDPIPDVEKVGLKSGISKDNNKFENISMDQGQDKRATDALFKAARKVPGSFSRTSISCKVG